MLHRSVSPSAADAAPFHSPGKPWDEAAPAASNGTADSTGIAEDEIANPTHAQMNDPSVGVEKILYDQHGPGALDPVPLRSLASLAAAQRETHNLTHPPPHPGCPFCAQNRTLKMGQSPSHESQRVVPLLVWDYCVFKSTGDAVIQACLALLLYPYSLFLACAVPHKGIDPSVIRMLVRLLRDAGLVQVAYSCDKDASVHAMNEQACMHSGRNVTHADSEDTPDSFSYPVAPVEGDEPDAPSVQIEKPAASQPWSPLNKISPWRKPVEWFG